MTLLQNVIPTLSCDIPLWKRFTDNNICFTEFNTSGGYLRFLIVISFYFFVISSFTSLLFHVKDTVL